MWLLDLGMCEVCVTVLDVWKGLLDKSLNWGIGKRRVLHQLFNPSWQSLQRMGGARKGLNAFGKYSTNTSRQGVKICTWECIAIPHLCWSP